MSPQPGAVPAAPPPAEDIAVWRKRFDKRPLSSNPAIAILDIEYNELTLSWKSFQDNLLPDDHVQFNERLQTPRDVLEVIRSVRATWMSSPRQQMFGRSVSRSERFISTLDHHSIYLRALPKNEQYCNLFYGVLQSIIKASANYPKIMKRLLKALVKVNESIAPQGDLPQQHFVLEPIAKFYSLTFLFLGEVMDWYVRRAKCRLLESPNHNVYSHFRNIVSRIQRNARAIIVCDTMDLDESDSELIPRTAQHIDLLLWEEARLSQLGKQKYDRRLAAQNAMTRLLIWEIQHDSAERLRLIAQRELLLAQMIHSAHMLFRPVTQQNSGIVCFTTPAVQDLGMPTGFLSTQQSGLTTPLSQDTSRFDWSKGSKHKCTRVEVQQASRHLQDFFHSDDQIADLDSDVGVVTEDNVIHSLKNWAVAAHSQVLAVGGPGSPSTTLSSPVALIAACYANLARKTKIPVISHFCSLPMVERQGMTLFEQGLIALAYSLIRQLIDFLPPVLASHAACDLSAERFSPLNGTLTSWKEVLSLIDILLHYAPPLLVCVIDGLEVIQDPSTDQCIRSLVQILLTHTRSRTTLMPDGSHRQNVLLKVLFTVDGRPSSLVESLARNDLILSEPNRASEPAAADTGMNPDVGVVMMNA